MLVLTGKLGQRIVIDDRITVTVLRVQGHEIQLGIEAPKEIPIKREELLLKPKYLQGQLVMWLRQLLLIKMN